MLTVKECCCGCSLRIGTIIIGYIFAVTGFLGTILCFVYMGKYKNALHESYLDGVYEFTSIMFAIGGTLALIQVLVSIPLIYGGYKHRMGFLIPWLVYAWIWLCLSVVSIILCFIAMPTQAIMFIGVLLEVIRAGLLFYCIVVVNSFRKSLREQQSTQPGVIYASGQTVPTIYPQQQNLPGWQSVQTPYPQQQYTPTSQTVHTTYPQQQNMPAWQTVETTYPKQQNMPESQTVETTHPKQQNI